MIRRRLLTGTLSNSTGKVISVGIWFVLTPFVLSRLGPRGYGLWMLVGAVAAYGALLDFGIGGAVVKYIAEHAAREEWEAARGLIASAQWLYLALAVAALALSQGLAPAFPHMIGVPPGEQGTAAALVRLAGVDVACALALTPARSALQGLQRYDLSNAVSVTGGLIGAAATVGVLLAGAGVLGMVAVSIPVTVGMGLASRWLTRRIAPELAFGWRAADRRSVRRLTAFSASLFAMQCGGRLQTKSGEFVIAALRPIDAVTPYVLARKLGEVAQLAAVQFLNVLMPLASELDARDDRRQLRTLYIVAGRLTVAIAAPAAIVLLFLGGPLLAWWVGPAYAAHGRLVGLLALTSLIGISQWPAGAVLQGMAKHRILAVTSLTAGIANVLLSVLLLPVFGLVGVAWGALIPTAAGSLGVVLPVTNRLLGVPLRTTLREIWVPGLLPGVAAAAVLWLARDSLGTAPEALIAAAAASTAVYAAGYLSLPVCAMEREALRDVIAYGARRVRRAPPSGLGIDQQRSS